MPEPGNRTDEPTDPVAVDVLVVGGGVQGLTVLRECTDRGYAAALVTDASLGSGQTLHSHGILNSGYQSPDPERRRSVEADWLPFLRDHGVETYGADRFFGVVPRELYEGLQEVWEASGYPFEEVSPDALPGGFATGLPAEPPLAVLQVEEHCVPKRGLVRALREGVSDRILLGDLTGARFEAAADGAATIETVDIELAASDVTVTLAPTFVVAATGTGTRPFVDGLIDDPSFGAAADEAADRFGGAIRDQLDRITYERAHMICLRGPTDVLPRASVLLGSRGLSVVSADVDVTHDRVGGDRRTWYVTPRQLAPEPMEDTPAGHLADPEPAAVSRGIEELLAACPPLREALDRLEFGVYAGVKQNVGASRTAQFCEPLEGVPNLVIALPSVIGGAWVNARTAADLVEGTVEPGDPTPLPGAGAGVRVGDVVERTDDFEWRSWEGFHEAYPEIVT